MRVPPVLVDLGFKVLGTFHRAVVDATGGRLGGRAFGNPVVQLHTVGRVSGRPRTTMLLAPVVDGDRVVVVASKGGDERDPDWFKNLQAHPDAELTIGGRRRPVHARVATGDERADLWARAAAAYRGYDAYRKRTSRQIPLVVLEPR